MKGVKPDSRGKVKEEREIRGKGQGKTDSNAITKPERASGEKFGVGQGLALRVLGGDDGGGLQLPVYAQRRVVPADAALVLRVPVVGSLVQEVRALGQHDEAVRKAFRYPQHELVLGGQFLRHAPAKGRRAPADIHHNVEHRAFYYAHQLGLRMLDLVVQSAQHVLHGARMVVLHEIRIAAGQLGEPAPVEALEKESSIVAIHLGFDDQHVGDGGVDQSHGRPLSLSTLIR